MVTEQVKQSYEQLNQRIQSVRNYIASIEDIQDRSKEPVINMEGVFATLQDMLLSIQTDIGMYKCQ